MPPQATEPPPMPGFRYTPSSYLQRTRLENRPWSSAGDEESDFALMQEQRPGRKHSTLDAQSRIQRRKDLYKGILKGQYELNRDAEEEKAMDDLEYSTRVLESFDTISTTLSWSSSMASSSHPHHTAAAPSSSSMVLSPVSTVSAEQARQARQKRLSANALSMPPTAPSSLPSAVLVTPAKALDAQSAKVRSLRAQRLRILKQQSVEEDDFSERLKERRLQELKEEEEQKRQQEEKLDVEEKEEEEAKMAWLVQQRLERERAAMAEERRLLAAARLRGLQEEPEQTQEDQDREPSRLQPRRRVKRSTRISQQNEPTLFDEVGMLFRESGIFKTCVTSCFGDDDDLKFFGEPKHSPTPVLVKERRVSTLSSGMNDLDLQVDDRGSDEDSLDRAMRL